MAQKSKRKVIQLFYPLAAVTFFIIALVKGGVRKIMAENIAMTFDPIHEPPSQYPVICDPVHEPPAANAVNFAIERPATALSALVILIFPYYFYRVIRKFFTIQFTSWQLVKKVVWSCFVWSIGYSLLLAVAFCADILIGSVYWQFNRDNFFKIFLWLVPIFLLLNMLAGLELLLISIKDRRFLATGLLIFLISAALFSGSLFIFIEILSL
jgi:hypothetical protein